MLHSFVHLDLKGAPWKVPYLEEVILTAKSWGATGLLIEWEDTFPYYGDLTTIGSQGIGCGDGLYSMEEVKHIVRFAESNGLEVIQLVQTIGHLEFVLKHPKLSHLREEPRSPAVLCPSKVESQRLVRQMIDQVLGVQHDANYIHIGADEVWYTGLCRECKMTAEAKPFGLASIFLEHIMELAIYIKQKRPNLTILMWDDMLRNVSSEALNYYKLGELVQPVLWDYSATDHFNGDEWRRRLAQYRRVFPTAWPATAYKGANGSCRMICDVGRYVSNHVAWAQIIRSNRGFFAGIIYTGWSRFEHYATLCELLPVALPCLFSCLKSMAIMLEGGRDPVVVSELGLGCPGAELSRAVAGFSDLRSTALRFMHDDAVCTFMNPFQISRNFTNNMQVECISRSAKKLHSDVLSIEPVLKTLLLSLTGERTTTEWLETWVTPLAAQLVQVSDIADQRQTIEPNVVPFGQ